MTGMSFVVGNPAGGTTNMNPSHYRIVHHFLGHQELEFDSYAPDSWDRVGQKVTVTGQDASHPCFLGWVERIDGSHLHQDPNKPKRYNCVSFSKDLEYRYPYRQIYKVGENLADIINDAAGSQGLLWQAKSLTPDSWEGSGPFKLGCFWGPGTRILNKDVYLGTTLLPVVAYPPGANQCSWLSGDLYVGTPNSKQPNSFPCYVKEFKETFIKRDTVAAKALGGQVTAGQGNIFSVLKRLFRTSAQEFEFVNKADGYQWLYYADRCGRGQEPDPPVYNFTSSNVYDWTWIAFDPAEYGFQVISLKGQGAYDYQSWCDLSPNPGTRWKDYVIFDSSIDPSAAHDAVLYEANHRYDPRGMIVWAPENHSILCGDWVTVDGNTFRVWEKTLEDNVMELVCYYGGTDYFY